MNIRKHIPDTDLATEGVWLDYMGAQFKIASQDNGRYDRALLKATRKVSANDLRQDPMIMQGIVTAVIAETIILDWKGVTDGDTPLPPTQANKVKVLKEVREFREWVGSVAGDVSNFQREALAADAADLKSGADVAS